MDEAAFKARAERLVEVAKVIEKLPSEIRSQAFPLLAPYVGGMPAHKAKTEKADGDKDDSAADAIDGEDREAFFTRFPHDKPADNVKLIAAWWYSQHGTATFELDDVKTLADDVGLTIPDRFNMTLESAQSENKALFKKAGRGAWQPTVHGESYFKATYQVKKGKKPIERTEQ